MDGSLAYQTALNWNWIVISVTGNTEVFIEIPEF